jgi:hypothetical protein
MREKNREASAASSRFASLELLLSAPIAMTPKPGRAPAFRVALEDLYDVDGEAPVCAAQHLRVIFLSAAGAPARAGDD